MSSTKTIAFGKEDVAGEPAKQMHVLGTDTPLTLKVKAAHVGETSWQIPILQRLSLENAHRLFVTCALANLFTARRKLMAAAA